jgi:hypothetical protein
VVHGVPKTKAYEGMEGRGRVFKSEGHHPLLEVAVFTPEVREVLTFR